MKFVAVLAFALVAFSAQSQSLKEALYGGRLKADTGAVLRRGDSAKIRENMAQKVIEDSVKSEAIAVAKEAAIAEGKDTTGMTASVDPLSGEVTVSVDSSLVTAAAAEKAAPKDNNEAWKLYMDEMTTSIKAEALQSNKVKKGNYFVLIDYRINTDGQVSVTNVTVDPENSFLQQNIKDRLTLNPAKLFPIIDNNGRARTVNRKQTLNLVK
jgi:hypothetical protein